MGRVTPNVEYSPGERPHFESFAAPWLPTLRYEYEIESYITISSGQVTALDTNGHLVPAGLRKAWNVADSSTILTYVAADATENVIDLTTGEAVAGATSYTEAQVTQALKERGFIRADQRAMDFISKPIGFASYNYWKASGSDWWDPSKLYQHNFRPQALCAVTCDYVSTFPVVPAVATTETMANDRTGGAAGLLEDYIDGTETRAAGWFTSEQISGLVKYSSVTAGDDVVCYMFVNHPIAVITDESPITHSNSQLTKKVSAVGNISAAGDYFIDYELGLLFLYEAGGDAIPTGWAVTDTITYYHYQDVAGAAQITTYASATGNLEFGDFLTYDANSNLIKAELDIANAEGYDASFSLYSADPEYDSETDNAVISTQLEKAIDNHLFGIVGQIIGVNTYPKDALERVKTALQGYSAANMRAPGSATGGRSDQLTYANAAEKMIIVNLIFR
jgi:hypothetical protein